MGVSLDSYIILEECRGKVKVYIDFSTHNTPMAVRLPTFTTDPLKADPILKSAC